MDFLDLARQRYSVRSFEQRPVEQAAIDQILQAADAAPTAHNNQPQAILAVHSQNGLQALKKCTECHYDAPLAFIVCYDRNTCWKRSYDGRDSGEVDSSIVATHMMLEAAQLGIGSTWIMHFIPEAVRVEFELPDGIEPVSILVMGYPDAQPSPRHFSRRGPESYVSYR